MYRFDARTQDEVACARVEKVCPKLQQMKYRCAAFEVSFLIAKKT